MVQPSHVWNLNHENTKAENCGYYCKTGGCSCSKVLLKKMERRRRDVSSSFIGRSEEGSCSCSPVETEEHNNLPVFICRRHFLYSCLKCSFLLSPTFRSRRSLPASSSITTPHGYMGFVVPTGCPRYVLPAGHFNQMAKHWANTALIQPPPSGWGGICDDIFWPPTTAHDEDECRDASWSINSSSSVPSLPQQIDAASETPRGPHDPSVTHLPVFNHRNKTPGSLPPLPFDMEALLFIPAASHLGIPSWR